MTVRLRARGILRLAIALLLVAAPVLLPARAAPAAGIDGFTRGDCNSDGYWDISDAISSLVWLLASGPAPSCSDACDVNDDGTVDIADGIYALSSLFGLGPVPPPPYPECGLDFTLDPLVCEVSPCAVVDFAAVRSYQAPTARVGLPYQGSLPVEAVEEVRTTTGPAQVILPALPFVEWHLPNATALPAGLSLDPSTGEISGVATEPGAHDFAVIAEDALGEAHLVRVALAVFSADESEVEPAQDFTIPGPHAVTVSSDFFIYTHELPWPFPYPLWSCAPVAPPTSVVNQGKQVRIYLPGDTATPAPLLLFHHGAGFTHIQYDDLLEHLASHGFACASVNDPYSFNTYPVHYCWGGHDEAARVLLALRELVAARAADPTSPLFGRLDLERIFYGGHSRGGASAIIAAELDPDVRGVIALQPTDAKGDSAIGGTSRWDRLPAVPLLLVSAEQDFDVYYPWAERLLERVRGAATAVTIYGGCHGYTTDDSENGCLTCTWSPAAPDVDQCRYIARDVQIRLTRQLAVAFLRRHGQGDLGVEGQLHGTEWIGSPYFSFASERMLGGATWVDRFELYPTNGLGGLWSEAGSGTAGIGSCYDAPAPVPMPLVPVENLVVELPTSGTYSLATDLAPTGAGLDVSLHRDVVFRVKNHDRWQLLDNFGYGWLTASLSLADSDGDAVAIPLAPYLPTVANHPEPIANLGAVPLKSQRFIDVRVPLVEFIAANPALDLDDLAILGLDFTVTPTPALNVSPTLGIDDLRFE